MILGSMSWNWYIIYHLSVVNTLIEGKDCGDQLTWCASSSVIVFSTSIGIINLMFKGSVTVEHEHNFSESSN